jgi:hypothetical protein
MISGPSPSCSVAGTVATITFAQRIGDAFIVADKGNSQKLLDAFPEVFMRGWHFAQAKRMTNNVESQDA